MSSQQLLVSVGDTRAQRDRSSRNRTVVAPFRLCVSHLPARLRVLTNTARLNRGDRLACANARVLGCDGCVELGSSSVVLRSHRS